MRPERKKRDKRFRNAGDPTPNEIKHRSAEVRERWCERQERNRNCYKPAEPWRPPTLSAERAPQAIEGMPEWQSKHPGPSWWRDRKS